MNKRTGITALALVSVAAVIYFTSMAGYAFPGESARLMLYWRGIDAPDAPVYPLMAVFAKLLGAGNLIAPICGIISVLLVNLLVSAFVSARVKGEDAERQRPGISFVAGLTAGGVKG